MRKISVLREVHPQLYAFLSYAIVDTIFRIYANSVTVKSRNHSDYVLFVGYLSAVLVSLLVGVAFLILNGKRTIMNISIY
jgi:hypothetical protein